ncbi:MAG: hypothetical protein ACTSYA_02905 [Candidatus Kariarchaeaceae archaeon]
MIKKLALKLRRKSKGSKKDLNQENFIICYACGGLGLSKGSIRRTSTISCGNRLRKVDFDVCEVCHGKKIIPVDND